MIQGTIKDYTISTLEELIEKAIPRNNKPIMVSIHTHLQLHIIEFKWDNPKHKLNGYKLYIRYINAFNKEVYKPMRSNFTKQTLWEILNHIYK